jgi:hypothetical protein
LDETRKRRQSIGVDPPNPDVDKVSFGPESLFMTEPAYQMGDVSALASPRFEMPSNPAE